MKIFQIIVLKRVAGLKKTMKGVVLSMIQLKIITITLKITRLLSVNLLTNVELEYVLKLGNLSNLKTQCMHLKGLKNYKL